MVNKLNYIIFVIFMLTHISCGSSNEGTKKQSIDKFTGTWNWVRTTGGFAGEITTPDSTGKSMRLVFPGNGEVHHFDDMNMIYSGKYRLAADKTIFSQDSIPVIIIGKMTYSYIFPTENTLMLIENAYDGFTYEYTKGE